MPRSASCVLFASPLGPLRLVASDAGLAYLGFAEGERPERLAAWAAARGLVLQEAGSRILEQATRELGEYFRGERRAFTVPLDVSGTPFQESVWARLHAIPFGRTTTYGAIARELGVPGSERAVGSANGANPVGILVPCHRVIGEDGSLTGYAGGMRNKAKLLAHERMMMGQTRLPV